MSRSVFSELFINSSYFTVKHYFWLFSACGGMPCWGMGGHEHKTDRHGADPCPARPAAMAGSASQSDAARGIAMERGACRAGGRDRAADRHPPAPVAARPVAGTVARPAAGAAPGQGDQAEGGVMSKPLRTLQLSMVPRRGVPL